MSRLRRPRPAGSCSLRCSVTTVACKTPPENALPGSQGPALFQSGAEAGDADAQFNLGACHADGIGTPQSHQSAVHWWRKAAEQEHASALHALGQCHQHGLGTPVNTLAADACLQAAVRKTERNAACLQCQRSLLHSKQRQLRLFLSSLLRSRLLPLGDWFPHTLCVALMLCSGVTGRAWF